MRKEKWETVQTFLKSVLEIVRGELDKEVLDFVKHYLEHDEYEMAFEALFIEIMNLDYIPKIDFDQSEKIGIWLKLNEESIFDYEFWSKFKNYQDSC